MLARACAPTRKETEKSKPLARENRYKMLLLQICPNKVAPQKVSFALMLPLSRLTLKGRSDFILKTASQPKNGHMPVFFNERWQFFSMPSFIEKQLKRPNNQIKNGDPSKKRSSVQIKNGQVAVFGNVTVFYLAGWPFQ